MADRLVFSLERMIFQSPPNGNTFCRRKCRIKNSNGLPLHHPVVDVVVGGEFGALGGTGGDGAFEIAVVDAGRESAHEPGQISRRAKDAPRIIGACIRGDGRAGASGLGKMIEILPAAGANMKGVRFFADDGKETELGAEPHE